MEEHLYLKCPSCCKSLGSKLEKYYKNLNIITNNTDTSQNEKEELSKELLITYDYNKICCRLRILSLRPYFQ
jgi:DNA-directed RNA polymerase subunit N (RpoN/RPB10)